MTPVVVLVGAGIGVGLALVISGFWSTGAPVGRMALTKIGGMARYLEILRNDADELELLAKDLLINVTSFFRDPEVFDYLGEKIVPELIANHLPDQPLRIWVAGCSTGEETYSLAMLFHEDRKSTRLNSSHH